jgi:hypothetical protein
MKLDLKRIGEVENVGWIYLTHNKEKWRELAGTGENSRDSKNMKNTFTTP